MMKCPSPFPLHPSAARRPAAGFTLVEMIIVIVITGIVGGMVAVFLKAPIQQYMDITRRTDMTDIADTALRRITRDIRLALPNSVRVTGVCGGAGTTCFIEFLPTAGGGRYRADTDATDVVCPGGNADDDILSFTGADTCFEVLGGMPPAAIGDQVVVYNLGIAGADAYAGNTLATHNRRPVGATGASSISIASASALPFDSPGHRFQVVTTPVTYVCAPAVDGVGGTLTRWQGYPIQGVQPIALPVGGSSALMANNVSRCNFTYDALVVAQRSGLVTMNLGITESGETVTLYNTIHVSNTP
jgi:MSHA biogenesis protein MshO